MKEVQHPNPGYLDGVSVDQKHYPIEDGYVQVPDDMVDAVVSWLEEGHDVEYDGLEVDLPDDLPDLDSMNMDELKETYEELGGKEADSESPHMGKKDEVKAGIKRLR